MRRYRGQPLGVSYTDGVDTRFNDIMVPGVTSATGTRFSASYVDQFANRTLGVAVGFARLDSPSQRRVTELVEYGDYTPYGLPLSGNAPSKVGNGQALLPMFWGTTLPEPVPIGMESHVYRRMTPSPSISKPAGLR